MAGWAIVLLPLAPFTAACLALALGRTAPRAVAPLVIAGTTVSLLVAVWAVVVDAGSRGIADTVRGPAAAFDGLSVGLDLRVDGLAALVSLMVAVVALSVQVYSTAYMHGGPRYPSYASLVSLFTAAMLLVVVADDLFVLLVGWEVMGICSYFLIGHHWEEEGARAAAIKAFVMTRLGDIGLLFGIFVLGVAAGSFRISDVTAAAASGRLSGTVLTVGGLLVLAGVVGKSAQFPLHSWLPDAMAGPTPVSALIHAATMVAAGIFLVARLYPVFLGSPAVLAVMAVIAAVTMLGSALAALAQTDLKRILAWSTVSQLAYMLAALAAGSYRAAGFHLLSHAAFKALLFLAAGAVGHAVGSTLLRDMGGLRLRMPLTAAVTALGLLALAGVPPLSGGLSKEAVIGVTEVAAAGDTPVAAWAGWLLLVVELVTVVVTSAYATRAWLVAFCGRPADEVAPTGAPASGEPMGEQVAVSEPHDPPAAMRWPLLVLAAATALLGATLLGSRMPRWLSTSPPARSTAALSPEASAAQLHLSPSTTVLSLLLVALGALAAYAVWVRADRTDPAVALGRARTLLADGFGVDTVYDALVVRPVRTLSRLPGWVDGDVVDTYVGGSAWLTRAVGRALRVVQAGQVQAYLGVALGGAVVIAVAVVAVVAP